MSVLSGLNPQQREAVEHGDGPMLILAGAGSGKTRAITHRIAHLIAGRGVPPQSILAMTFTNKAAEEMQSRVADLLPGRYQNPTISTFHSFCVRVLRRDYEAIGRRRDFVIYDDADQLGVVKALGRRMGLDEKQYPPRSILARISGAKNRGMDPASFRENAADPRSERIAVVFERYQAALRTANALDFDDLLLETERLLRQNAATAEYYNDRYRYLLIDEYQDTNRPQYELMKLLAQHSQNVCVVGDEDQSIYSWRGADIRNILDFEKDFPNAKVIRLEQNYRSTRNILDAASAVVANNTERKGKRLWTEAGGGEPIGFYRALDGENEALWVADTIRQHQRRDPNLKFAVLYRMNAQSRPFEEAFRRYALQYRVVGGFSFYERAEVKDLLAYLKLALNPHDSMSLLRVINTPARGIGRTTVEALEGIALENNLSLYQAVEKAVGGEGAAPTRAHNSLRDFLQLIVDVHDLAGGGAGVRDLLKTVVDRTGYTQLLKQDASPEAESRIENIDELLSAAADADERGDGIVGFLDHAALISDQDQFDSSAGITLMTLHAAKGLEFPVVFLVGLEEGIFPHSRSQMTHRELEEERRLCYVGMTRARQRLYLTYAAKRRRYGGGAMEPSVESRFLSEVPPELLENTGETAGPVYVREGYSQEENRSRSASKDRIQSFFRKPSGPPAAPAAAPSPLNLPPRAANASGSFRERGKVSARGFKLGSRVRHANYGVGTVLRIEGEGEDTKLTVSFPGIGLKKMVEKFAGLLPA
jgi:DNA helicase-2/ATP-dependent DNA helicase PcrA